MVQFGAGDDELLKKMGAIVLMFILDGYGTSIGCFFV